MNESIGCEPPIRIECIESTRAYAKCASNYVYKRPMVDETRHGVRDVAVNVRGAAVSGKQFTHAKIVS